MTKEEAIKILEEMSKWEIFGRKFSISYTRQEVCEAIRIVLNLVKGDKNDNTGDK